MCGAEWTRTPQAGWHWGRGWKPRESNPGTSRDRGALCGEKLSTNEYLDPSAAPRCAPRKLCVDWSSCAFCPDLRVVAAPVNFGTARVATSCDSVSANVPGSSLSPTDHTTQGRCPRASDAGMITNPSEELHCTGLQHFRNEAAATDAETQLASDRHFVRLGLSDLYLTGARDRFSR